MGSYSNNVPISSTSARGWVERISNFFTKEVCIQIDHLPPISVFEVPKALSSQKPESYTPQLIALGPYHHLRPDLYQMERYKLAAIKSISTPEQVLHFEEIVITKLKDIDPSTRACYNKFMDYDQDTLAWIMAIDGCFFLNLLRSYVDHHHSSNLGDKTLLDNTIITRDIMMLENQIPYVHLKEIRKALHMGPEDHEVDRELFWMLLDLCEALSPVKLSIDRSGCDGNREPLHLLDLMYHMVTIGPACGPPSPVKDVPIRDYPLYNYRSSSSSSASSSSSLSSDEEQESEALQDNVERILELVQTIGDKKTQEILKPVQVVSSIPWSTISGLFRKGTLQHGDKNSTEDEFRIPTVSHLLRYADIKCLPIAAGIIDIKFVEQEDTLYLPVLNLNASSEVILRNLVAYEAATSKSNLEFARYINLMNGIIDTAEDVKLLRHNGVVKGVLRDEEVADLFNGMKKSYVRCNKSSNVDVAVEEVNKYYDKKVMVRFLRQMKKHFIASWKCLALFSTILLMVILSVQSFCEVYACSRFWTSK